MKKNDFLAMSADERKWYIKDVERAAYERWQRERAKNAALVAYAEKKLANGSRLNYNEFYLLYGVKISTDMTGKMAGIDAISTCCLANKFCVDRLANKVGICEFCFAAASFWKRGLLENMVLNFRVLTETEIPLEAWPVWQTERGRIEAFGDLFNTIQARNYLNCIRANSQTTFGWWTKNPWLINKALAGGTEKPANAVIILSEQFMNNKGPANAAETMLKMYPFIDKVFSVFSLDYIRENEKDLTKFISCGGRSCVGCDNCYLNAKISPVWINELEKSDAKKVRGVTWN